MHSRWREGAAADRNALQQDPPRERLASDFQSLTQCDRQLDANERVKASAEQPVDKADKSQKQLWPRFDGNCIRELRVGFLDV